MSQRVRVTKTTTKTRRRKTGGIVVTKTATYAEEQDASKNEVQEKNKYCVYKHTAPDGRVYIGITGNDPKIRWSSGSGYRNNTYFTRCIKKYGWTNFKHEILFDKLSKKRSANHRN